MRDRQVLARSNDLQSIDELLTEATESSAVHLIESCPEWKEIRGTNVRSQAVRDKCNAALACFHDGKKTVDVYKADDVFADNVVTVMQSWQQHVLPAKKEISEALQLYEAQRKYATDNSSKVLFPLRDIACMESAIVEIAMIENAIELVGRLRDLKQQNAHLNKISAVDLLEWKDIEAVLKSLRDCRGSLCCDIINLCFFSDRKCPHYRLFCGSDFNSKRERKRVDCQSEDPCTCANHSKTAQSLCKIVYYCGLP